MRKYLPPGTTTNPFKTPVKRTKISGDLLGLLKSAVIRAEALGYLPPRLQNPNGTKEDDDQYIAHYSMNAANLGYEVSGLSTVNFQINQFRFTGVGK